MEEISVLAIQNMTEKLYKEAKYKELGAACTKIIEKFDETALQQPEVRQMVALAYNNRGHSLYMQVFFEEANTDYTRALQLDPNLAVAYYNRATIRYRLGSPEEALVDLKEALRLDPTNPEYLEAQESSKELLAMRNRLPVSTGEV
ncbi:uncharacterized protein LOC143022403 [Oratosquilla oratoria]|uniref:uncharacterized protein LOC143022403 n=1 Tax=Oratosquilla oratoria TaxID=337810 RepID=UPI003F76095B